MQAASHEAIQTSGLRGGLVVCGFVGGVMYIKAMGNNKETKTEMLFFLLMIIVSAKASWLKGTRVPKFIDAVSLGFVSL